MQGEERGLYYLVRIQGNFTAQALPKIRETVENALAIGHLYLAFDLEKTIFIDSTGIGTLVNLHKTMTAKKGGLYLISTSKAIFESLSKTHVFSVIPQYDSLEIADQSIGS